MTQDDQHLRFVKSLPTVKKTKQPFKQNSQQQKYSYWLVFSHTSIKESKVLIIVQVDLQSSISCPIFHVLLLSSTLPCSLVYKIGGRMRGNWGLVQEVVKVQVVGPLRVGQLHSMKADIVEHTVGGKLAHMLVQQLAWVQVVGVVDLLLGVVGQSSEVADWLDSNLVDMQEHMTVGIEGHMPLVEEPTAEEAFAVVAFVEEAS